MARLYTAVFSSVAVTAAQDLFELVAPADAIVQVYRIEMSQSTETGDAAEESLPLLIKRGIGSVTSGTGGTTPTAQPVEDGDAAFGGTVEVNNTTKMVVGTGTIETIGSHNWNLRVPFDKVFLPEERIIISPSNRITVELVNAPADSVTMSGTITFAEIGG